MERYATDLTLSFGFGFYFPLWLFFKYVCLYILYMFIYFIFMIQRGNTYNVSGSVPFKSSNFLKKRSIFLSHFVALTDSNPGLQHVKRLTYQKARSSKTGS